MIDVTEKWVVTYAIDSLDPSPLVMSFDTWDEAHDWLAHEIDERVRYIVEHSPYSVTEEEYDAIVESETVLAKVERKRFVRMTEKEDV